MENLIITTPEQLRTMIAEAIREALPAAAGAQTPPPGHLKGIKELAAFLKVSHAKAQEIKNSGILPYFQTGKTILFDPVKVVAAMEQHGQSQSKRRPKR